MEDWHDPRPNRPAGCLSYFDLRTDKQAITWHKANRQLNKVYVLWLSEMEDLRFNVTRLAGSRNPADPLSVGSARWRTSAST